jgi:hypothetical protein
MDNTKGRRLIMAIVVIAVGVGGYYFLMNKNEVKLSEVEIKKEKTNEVKTNEVEANVKQNLATQGKKVTVYRSPNCGCCIGYADELKKQGYEVEVVSLDDLNPVKDKYGIPANLQSCHTTVIDGYFIEGHVPIEVVQKLLKEKPEIDGIGLPGMPIGTPGMPGPKREPYRIYKSVDGKFTEYITI